MIIDTRFESAMCRVYYWICGKRYSSGGLDGRKKEDVSLFYGEKLISGEMYRGGQGKE